MSGGFPIKTYTKYYVMLMELLLASNKNFVINSNEDIMSVLTFNNSYLVYFFFLLFYLFLFL